MARFVYVGDGNQPPLTTSPFGIKFLLCRDASDPKELEHDAVEIPKDHKLGHDFVVKKLEGASKTFLQLPDVAEPVLDSVDEPEKPKKGK